MFLGYPGKSADAIPEAAPTLCEDIVQKLKGLTSNTVDLQGYLAYVKATF